ncbi:MAG TPA: recombinase family protein [Candidatus Paceibacterota bacterium]|nr:recombinase family protein [Candidatus Paceibacterota bacterium]
MVEEIISTAIYCRVSDDKKKADGGRRQDIERQNKILGDPLTNKGIKFKTYLDDGKSAFTDDLNQRLAFKQLLNDCRRHYIKTIYIEDLTRFSRNLSLGLQWLKELGELDVHVISLREGEIEVTSSKGWAQSAMLLMFAEWDSRIKSEKVKSGMEKAKNLGKHIGRKKNE